MVKNILKEMALKSYAAEEVAQKCVVGMFNGVSLWVGTTIVMGRKQLSR